METIDYRKLYGNILKPKVGQVEFLQIPAMHFLMIDGHGDPNTSQEYMDTFGALYGIAYTLKFKIKKERQIDYNLLATEGLWWVPDMAQFSTSHKEDWDWTMMLFQPDFISSADIDNAKAQLTKKKNVPGLEKVRYELFEEGLCAQTMHLGPYSAEKPTIELLHQEISMRGYSLRGKHHEIYMGDVRKSAPEKLKTIIRQPVS